MHSLVGQVPIVDTDGAVQAIVSVSERYPSVWELLSGAGERLLFYLGLGAALGMLASWLLSRRIKRHTRGLEIAEIADLADHREALLHSIREGVVAVNNEGDITLLNDSAQELLGISGAAVGRRADSVGLDPAVVEFLLSGEDGRDVVIATRTRVLALNRRAATSQGQRIGTVTTMRDSTELAALQGQLSSHKSVTDTLRAQTHEFANQLHTISGLVQLGEYDAVRDLVGTLTRRRAEISDAVTQRISDPAVAALLIAKTTLAAESGVSLRDRGLLAPGGAAAGAGDRCDYVAGQPDRQRRRRLGGFGGGASDGANRRLGRTDDLGRRFRAGCAGTPAGGDLCPRRHLQAGRARRTGYRAGVGEAGQRAAWWDRGSHRCSNRWRALRRAAAGDSSPARVGRAGGSCVTCSLSTTISWSPRFTAGSWNGSTVSARSASHAPAPRLFRRRVNCDRT